MDDSIRVVITDLDGTLLDREQQISKRDLGTLRRLGEKSICRVIATGRSYFSFSRVLPQDFPIDYLIFSSGAGIMRWSSKEILISHSFDAATVSRLVGWLKELRLDFMIQHPIPDNHRFYYHLAGEANPDFFRRIDLYRDYCLPLDGNLAHLKSASQMLIITKEDESLLMKMKEELSGVSVIRTTSPLDHTSMWIEIFPEGVSKGEAAERLCRLLGCGLDQVLAVGNDFNDLDLLRQAGRGVVVANAPAQLQSEFTMVASHQEDGFSEAVQRYLSGGG